MLKHRDSSTIKGVWRGYDRVIWWVCNRWIQTSHHPSVGKPEASQKNLEVFGGFISRWYRTLQEAMILPSHCWLLLPFPVYFRVGDPTLILLAKAKAKWEVMIFLTMRPDLYVISCHINKILSCRHRCQGGLWELIHDIMVIWIYIKEMSVTDGCTFSRGVRSWGHPSKGYMRWLNIALSPVALWIWRG